MKINILITGAFGFVGTNLSKAFSSSFKQPLIAVDISEQENNVYQNFFSWNNLDTIEWKNVNTIIHLAGKAHDTKNTTEEKTYFDINVGLTKKIFEHFLSSNATKFIFFSSVKAVADNVSGDFLTEETPANPQTAYGKSKLAAEQYILNRSSVISHRSYPRQLSGFQPSTVIWVT